DTVDPAAPVITSPIGGSDTEDTTPLVQGTAEPGTTVTVYVDGLQIGTTIADGSGNWSLTISPPLSIGSHTLDARATDAAGNQSASSTSVTISIIAAAVAPPPSPAAPPPSPAAPPPVSTPSVEGCTIDEAITVIPPKVAVVGVSVSRKTLLKFDVTSDQFAIARMTIKQGSKRVGSAARAINAGKRQIVVKVKKLPKKDATFSVRLSSVSMSGGKSVADARLTIDAAGKFSVGPLSGNAGEAITSVADCNNETGAGRIKVKLAAVGKIKIGANKLTVTVVSNQMAISSFTVIQNSKVLSRKVFVLVPGVKLKRPLKLLGSSKFAKGKVTLKASTFSVDGVRIKVTRNLTVK
ncbi:MAG: Ig-like domain-containing protein, partial [Phycisphaerales bacterium]|nr:Ig-like domain-containing protein [Phycisphaerales bacterium]